jgi:hypothetical protein
MQTTTLLLTTLFALPYVTALAVPVANTGAQLEIRAAEPKALPVPDTNPVTIVDVDADTDADTDGKKDKPKPKLSPKKGKGRGKGKLPPKGKGKKTLTPPLPKKGKDEKLENVELTRAEHAE